MKGRNFFQQICGSILTLREFSFFLFFYFVLLIKSLIGTYKIFSFFRNYRNSHGLSRISLRYFHTPKFRLSIEVFGGMI